MLWEESLLGAERVQEIFMKEVEFEITLERKVGHRQGRRQRKTQKEEKAWTKFGGCKKTLWVKPLMEWLFGVIHFLFWNTSSLLPDIRAVTGHRPADPRGVFGREQWSCPIRWGESNWFVCRRNQWSPPPWLQQVCSWHPFAGRVCLSHESSYDSLFSWNCPSFLW